MKKLTVLIKGVIFALVLSVALSIPGYAASVNITSPSNGINITEGSSATISGSTDPGTAVKIFVDGAQKGFIVADGSGSWTFDLDGLSLGAHTITARAVSSDYKAVFTSVDLGNGTAQVNTLDQPAGTVNTDSGWPISLGSNAPFLVVVSPDNSFAYVMSAGLVPGGSYVSKVNLASPGAPSIVGSYPAASTPSAGTFNANGSELMVTNGNGTLTFINTATNSIISTIASGQPEFNNAIKMPNGLVYATDTSTSTVVVIDLSTRSVIKSFSTCDGGAYSLLNLQADPNNSGEFYVYCSSPQPSFEVRSLSTDAITRGFNVTYAGFGSDISPDGQNIIAPRFGDNFIDIYSTVDGTLIRSVELTDQAYSVKYSPDSKSIIAATPGSFNVTNIDIIDTTTWAVDSVATPGLVALANALTVAIDDEDSLQINVTVAVATPAAEQLAETGSDPALLSLSGLMIIAIAFVGIKRVLFFNS